MPTWKPLVMLRAFIYYLMQEASRHLNIFALIQDLYVDLRRVTILQGIAIGRKLVPMVFLSCFCLFFLPRSALLSSKPCSLAHLYAWLLFSATLVIELPTLPGFSPSSFPNFFHLILFSCSEHLRVFGLCLLPLAWSFFEYFRAIFAFYPLLQFFQIELAAWK